MPKKSTKKQVKAKKSFYLRRRYILFFVTIIISSFSFFGGKEVLSLPIFYGDSFMTENYSQIKLSSVESMNLPIQVDGAIEDLGIKSLNYISVDRATMTPLLQKDANKKVQIASTTKLMTAIVVLENSKLEDIVTIDSNYPSAPAGRMGLFVTEKITVENILNGLLISSSNDAAEALAYYIGKGSYNSFIQMMNVKALEIGMINTRYSNAMGLDNGENYSTPQDLVYLADYALKNEFIAKTVTIKEKRVKNVGGDITHLLLTTNKLLSDNDINILGLKTGSTPGAGECLISFAKTKNGQEILTVLLGSPDRFGETKKVVQWIEENIKWR